MGHSQLRKLKLLGLRAARDLGVNALVISSRWRRHRLTILCYHVISQEDEHEWNPILCLSPEHFRSRMEILVRRGCSVLPLPEALRRLRSGSLPPRAVSITFDDGFYDFYAVAWPILRRLSFPATMYLTTYYSDHPQWPVFDLMLSYVLWKNRSRTLACPGVLPCATVLDEPGRARVCDALQEYCVDQKLSGAGQHELLQAVCRELGFDLESAIRKRLLCLMNGDEVRQVAAEGADIQLHTHRHRIFARKERFWREIDENRQRISDLTGSTPSHFCYPGNFRLPELPGWLRARGVESATTCDPGLAARESDPLLLPRVLDITSMLPEEFDAWICGVCDVLPKRPVPASPYQLAPDPEAKVGVA